MDIIQPTIIRLLEEDEDLEGVAHVRAENALIVFRGEEEAEAFRADTGQYPAEEGYGLVGVDPIGIARTCLRHGFDAVCVPDAPWRSHGDAAVRFCDVVDFVGGLKESPA